MSVIQFPQKAKLETAPIPPAFEKALRDYFESLGIDPDQFESLEFLPETSAMYARLKLKNGSTIMFPRGE